MITRNVVKNFRQDFAQVVEDLEDQYNVTLELGTIRFTSDNFRCKMSATDRSSISSSAIGVSQEALDFEKHAASLGLDKSDLGKKFRKGYSLYTIIGLKPRSYKYPIIVETENGTRYKYPAEVIRMYLGKHTK